MDDPLLWYEGSAIGPARWLHADKQGSIIGISDPGVTMIAINAYDEYGIPDDGSQASLGTKGRFRYTGQTLIPELGMYYYKARMYSPTLGRFLQTDPIGYEDQVNLYAYVANDPVNLTDPTGTEQFDEKKYKGDNLRVVRAINSVMAAKGDIKTTVKVNGVTLTISRHDNNISVSTTKSGYSVSFSGTYSSLKGREGFTITNAKISGDVRVSGNPGKITVFSGVGRESKQPGPAFVTQGTVRFTPRKEGGGLFGSIKDKVAGAVATQTIQAGKGQMLVNDDD